MWSSIKIINNNWLWVAKVEVRLKTAQIPIFERYLALTAFDFRMHLKMWNLALFDSLACTIVASAFWHCIALWLGLVANEWFYEDTMMWWIAFLPGWHNLGGTSSSLIDFRCFAREPPAALAGAGARRNTPQIYDEEYLNEENLKYMMGNASNIWWGIPPKVHFKTHLYNVYDEECLKNMMSKTSKSFQNVVQHDNIYANFLFYQKRFWREKRF